MAYLILLLQCCRFQVAPNWHVAQEGGESGPYELPWFNTVEGVVLLPSPGAAAVGDDTIAILVLTQVCTAASCVSAVSVAGHTASGPPVTSIDD